MPRGPLRRAATAGGLIAVSLLLAFGSLELFVCLYFGEQPKFPRHVVSAPWGLRYNDPHAHYRHKSADMTTYFRINGQGMRSDHDFAYAKGSTTRRVIVLGDSFTVGYEVDVEHTFAAVAESVLRESGYPVEVLNTGVSGFSTAEALLYLQRELLKYAPDLVAVVFSSTDFKDNVRSGLFVLSDGQLIAERQDYVPLGAVADHLNRNPVFNLLSERSNLFSFVKFRLTGQIKAWMQQSRLPAHVRTGAVEAAPRRPRFSEYEEQLLIAVLKQMHALLSVQGIPLVVMSVPDVPWSRLPNLPPDQVPLAESFPFARLRSEVPDAHFLGLVDTFESQRGKHKLYWTRSHAHWTPFSHRMAGQRLAQFIQERQLLTP